MVNVGRTANPEANMDKTYDLIVDLWKKHPPDERYIAEEIQNANPEENPLHVAIRAYVRFELLNIPKNIYISELPFYPFLTTCLTDALEQRALDNGKVVVSAYSTMLPRHFFNFPHDKSGSVALKVNKTKRPVFHYKHLCYAEKFVDTYRQTLQDQIAEANTESTSGRNNSLGFHRYTILCATEDAQKGWPYAGVQPSLLTEFLDDAQLALETCSACSKDKCDGTYCGNEYGHMGPVNIWDIPGPNSAILTLGFSDAVSLVRQKQTPEGKDELIEQLVAQRSVQNKSLVYPIRVLNDESKPSLLNIFQKQLHSPNGCNVIVIGSLLDDDAQWLLARGVNPVCLTLEDFSQVSSDFVHYALFKSDADTEPFYEVFLAANVDLDSLTVSLHYIDNKHNDFNRYKRFVTSVHKNRWTPSVKNTHNHASKSDVITALKKLSTVSLFSQSEEKIYSRICVKITSKASEQVSSLTKKKFNESQPLWDSLVSNQFIKDPKMFKNDRPVERFFEFARALTALCTLLNIYPQSVAKMAIDKTMSDHDMNEMFRSEEDAAKEMR